MERAWVVNKLQPVQHERQTRDLRSETPRRKMRPDGVDDGDDDVVVLVVDVVVDADIVVMVVVVVGVVVGGRHLAFESERGRKSGPQQEEVALCRA